MLPGFNLRFKLVVRWCLVGALCLGTAWSHAQNVAPSSAGNPTNEAASFDGGLTRDSLEEAAQPPRATPQPTRTSRRLAQQRNRRARQLARTSASEKRREERRRSLLTSFIYHWNGWVIRTFHTTKGTVRLRQVGFAG